MTQPTRKLAAIVFTDIVGFTELTSRDEAAAMSLLKWQREQFKPLVIELGGEWLKEVGDGLLLSFPSSQDAARCAIRIQEAAREMPDLKLRVGIHQGDIIQEGPDILGDGVNIASRIQQIAPRGGIALSEKVQQDISGYPKFEVISLGQQSLKGVARPMEVYCLSPFGLPEIPEYRLLRLTGQGAYGEVWLAQSLTGVYRAVKIVHRDQFEDAKPYEREFTGITRYEPVSRKHEGLIDLLHVGHGEDDSFFYYVMELADDQRAREEINPREYCPRTLQSELEARGKLSIGECLEVGSRLARGLAFLHDHNLLHRDVKPANIVYVDGHPKLADIGLVTTMDNASTLVGTMGYIPPEGPGKPSSDIYALGMVLYELSTGKDRADFPEIDVLDPELKGLNQACLKACSNDLSERFANAHAFADELDQLARGKFTAEPVSSSPKASNLKMGALAAALIAILALVLYQKSGDSNGENGEKPEPAIGSPSGPAAKLDLTKGLVAYYPFNGNAKDESGTGNDGKEVNGPALVEDRHGVANSAYSFDGKDDRIETPQKDFPKGKSDRTTSIWFRLPEKGNKSLAVLWGAGASASQKLVAIQIEQVIDGPAVLRTDSYGNSVPIKNTTLNDSVWHNVIWILTNGNAKTYIDGEVAEVRPFVVNTSDYHFSNIGGSHHSDQTLLGEIDDIRIYTRALSTEEVKALYDLEKPKSVSEKSLTKGLVAYYPFNGNAKDETGNGHDGTLINGAKLTSDSQGEAGKALLVPTQGAMARIPYHPNLSISDRITVSAWIKAPRLRQGIIKSAFLGIIDTGGVDVYAGYYMRIQNDHKMWIIISAGGGRYTHLTSQTEFGNEDEWVHVTFSYDDNELVFYVDGKRDASKKVGANYLKGWKGALPFKIGREQGGSLLGAVDDVRIYNRALSDEEVKALYDLEKPKSAPDDSFKKGLVAYYPFNGNANDASGNDHNGTVSGATPATDRYGISNSAYNFDGVDDFIEAPSTAGMNHSDVKTVALWYAPNNTGTGQWGVGKYRVDTLEGGWGLIVGPANHLHYNYKRSRIIGGLHTGSTNPMGLGVSEWVHLAATVNGNTVTLYKDGQVIGVNTIIADRNPRDNIRPLLIGAGLNPKARSGFVNGKLDDIRIYNRALSAEEVKKLFELEKPTREREGPTLRQYEVDRNTVLLEHFEGATTGKSNRPVSFDKGRIGQGLRLTPKTFLSWDKGPLAEGTYEFWFKLDEEKYLGTLASANFLGLPTAITILIKSGEKGNVYSELFTQGPDWSRPKHIENKIRVKQWNHVAISWGRKGINTYLNGVRIGFLEGTHLLNRSTGTWVMGAQIRTASRDGFSGVIDEVRISRIQREFKPEDFPP